MNAKLPIWFNIPENPVPKLGCVLILAPAPINMNPPSMLRPAYTYPKILQTPNLFIHLHLPVHQIHMRLVMNCIKMQAHLVRNSNF